MLPLACHPTASPTTNRLRLISVAVLAVALIAVCAPDTFGNPTPTAETETTALPASLETQLAEAQARVAELENRIAALESSPLPIQTSVPPTPVSPSPIVARLRQ